MKKPDMKKAWKDGRLPAVVRAVAALVVAFAVVWASGYAFVYQLGGAVEVTGGEQLEGNSYVSADIKWVMDIVGTENDRQSGEVRYYYAVAPIGNRFALVRFEADQLEAVRRLKTETREVLTGERKTMSAHMPVQGMVEPAEQGAYSLLSEWFNTNVEWMTIGGVVAADPSAADYLVDECILVDQVGRVNNTWAAVLSILALVLVLYALVELGLLATGFYKESRAAARLIKRVQRRKAKEKAKRAAERAAMREAKAKEKAEENRPDGEKTAASESAEAADEGAKEASEPTDGERDG